MDKLQKGFMEHFLKDIYIYPLIKMNLHCVDEKKIIPYSESYIMKISFFFQLSPRVIPNDFGSLSHQAMSPTIHVND